jgi:hypothetical protein
MPCSYSRLRWWRLSAGHLLVIGLFVALFAKSAVPIVDPDLWWHLATGNYIVNTHSIPHQDVFSYTATDHKWITHEWLTEVGMIGLYRLGGQAALILATCIIITLSFCIVYMQCVARPHLAVFAVLFGALASALSWGPRPQMLNMLLTALLLYLMHQVRQEKRALWWAFPALIALWANLHSGFFVAYVVLGTVIIGDLLAHLFDHQSSDTLDRQGLRKMALTLGACVAAAGLNPNGFKILWYPFETLGSRAMKAYILEWASPTFHQPEYWPTAVLLFAGVLALALSRRKRDLVDLLLFCGFSFMALLSTRHISLFALVAVPILTRYAAQIDLGRLRWDLSRPPSFRPVRKTLVFVNWLLVVIFVAAGAIRISKVLMDKKNAEERSFPVHAIEFIQSQGLAKQRMYNSYNWGGYLLWRGYKVFIDGRADVYLDDFFNQYMLAYLVRNNWRVPLDKFSVDYVLIERHAPLAVLLRESHEWRQIYEDDLSVIIVRNRPFLKE